MLYLYSFAQFWRYWFNDFATAVAYAVAHADDAFVYGVVRDIDGAMATAAVVKESGCFVAAKVCSLQVL